MPRSFSSSRYASAVVSGWSVRVLMRETSSYTVRRSRYTADDPRCKPEPPAGSVSVRTLTARLPGGRDGWALGNPSSYVGTGVPATDRRAVGQTVRSGFPRPHPPHPPGGSAAIGSPQFRTETLPGGRPSFALTARSARLSGHEHVSIPRSAFL